MRTGLAAALPPLVVVTVIKPRRQLQAAQQLEVFDGMRPKNMKSKDMPVMAPEKPMTKPSTMLTSLVMSFTCHVIKNENNQGNSRAHKLHDIESERSARAWRCYTYQVVSHRLCVEFTILPASAVCCFKRVVQALHALAVCRDTEGDTFIPGGN